MTCNTLALCPGSHHLPAPCLEGMERRGHLKVGTVQVSVLRESTRCSRITQQATSPDDPQHVGPMSGLPSLAGPMFGGDGVEVTSMAHLKWSTTKGPCYVNRRDVGRVTSQAASPGDP